MYSLQSNVRLGEALIVALSLALDAETECDFTEVGMGPYRREWN